MTLSAHCEIHKKCCKLHMARAHVAGTPCTDFSSLGAERREHGQTTLYLMAWLGLRLQLQEPTVVQENVVSFPPQLISQFLSEFYYIDIIVVDSAEFGFAATRVRKWCVMNHR
eukprot:2975894-Alexandrium_andersonii.AAC.1